MKRWVFDGCIIGVFGCFMDTRGALMFMGLIMDAHWALVLKKLVTMPYDVSLLQHHQAHLISIKHMVPDTKTPLLH